MYRREQILKHVEKSQRGIEIGPWFRPMVAKREGFNSLTLDVFDKGQLVLTASKDPNIPSDLVKQIEDVDLVGTSTDIEKLVDSRNELGAFDYIVSSHNFEHLPNPIKFLQGCGRVLKKDGLLSMAIPDHRACFDVFKSVSTFGQWIEAYIEGRVRPSPLQIFEHTSLTANFNPAEPAQSEFLQGPELAFRQWLEHAKSPDPEYQDAHCWSFTPVSFELLIFEAGVLGLSPFKVVEVSRTNGNEFYVHLRNVGCENLEAPGQSSGVRTQRQKLLGDMLNEPRYIAPPKRVTKLSRAVTRFLRKMAT